MLFPRIFLTINLFTRKFTEGVQTEAGRSFHFVFKQVFTEVILWQLTQLHFFYTSAIRMRITPSNLDCIGRIVDKWPSIVILWIVKKCTFGRKNKMYFQFKRHSLQSQWYTRWIKYANERYIFKILIGSEKCVSKLWLLKNFWNHQVKYIANLYDWVIRVTLPSSRLHSQGASQFKLIIFLTIICKPSKKKIVTFSAPKPGLI